MLKNTFFAPHGRKNMYFLMPFGRRNAPAIFGAMVYDLKALWAELWMKEGSMFHHYYWCHLWFATTEDNTFILLTYIAKIARKYHLILKLKKCQWFPKDIEFVRVDVSVNGNLPTMSKFKYLQTWSDPNSPRVIISFLGFTTIFYSRWIPFFEIKASSLRNLTRQFPNDYKFKANQFTQRHIKCKRKSKVDSFIAQGSLSSIAVMKMIFTSDSYFSSR